MPESITTANIKILCVHVAYAHACVHVCMHACGGQQSTLGIYVHLFLLYFLRQSLNGLKFINWARWSGQGVQGLSCICLPSAVITEMQPCAQILMWMPKIPIQVLMLVCQAPYPLGPFSSP